MTCPFKKEVSMVFCRAYPVRKPVPIDRVTIANTCEGGTYESCALFHEARARAERSTAGHPAAPPEPKGATS